MDALESMMLVYACALLLTTMMRVDCAAISYAEVADARSLSGNTGVQMSYVAPPPSPYWADVDGGSPSAPPSVTAENLPFVAPRCPITDAIAANPCNNSYYYRRVSGWCNNLQYPTWGMWNLAHLRFLPAVYDIAQMKTKSYSGAPLPSPRVISTGVWQLPQSLKYNDWTLMMMQFGQIVNHDLVNTPDITNPDLSAKKCSDCSSWQDPSCAPIPIPSNDKYLPSTHPSGQKRCLPFTRSARIGPDPVSIATSYLDLSTVYGSDECRERMIRLFIDGLLLEQRHPHGMAPLPRLYEGGDCIVPRHKCFFAGDDRANQHTSLIFIQTFFLREHNRLARALKSLNLHWDDERVYQTARQINIAQYQHIVLSEFLAGMIGFTKMDEYSLRPLPTGFYQGYSATVNPAIYVEFSTGVFRLGHSMVPEEFPLFDADFNPIGAVGLAESYFDGAAAFKPYAGDQWIRGLFGGRLPNVDLFLTNALVNRLFENRGMKGTGQDLLARNIARGRDHGLPGYAKYRTACGLSPINSWNDLATVMPQFAADALRGLYGHWDDIDLYIGGLAEYQLPDALVGPTHACIIASQFRNIRRSDRFWYESQTSGFNPAQLQSIRTSSLLSRFICQNMDDNNPKVQKYGFRLPSKTRNPLVDCQSLQDIDLKLWKEIYLPPPKGCLYMGMRYTTQMPALISPCLECQCLPTGMMSCHERVPDCPSMTPLMLQDPVCHKVCGSYLYDSSYTNVYNIQPVSAPTTYGLPAGVGTPSAAYPTGGNGAGYPGGPAGGQYPPGPGSPTNYPGIGQPNPGGMNANYPSGTPAGGAAYPPAAAPVTYKVPATNAQPAYPAGSNAPYQAPPSGTYPPSNAQPAYPAGSNAPYQAPPSGTYPPSNAQPAYPAGSNAPYQTPPSGTYPPSNAQPAYPAGAYPPAGAGYPAGAYPPSGQYPQQIAGLFRSADAINSTQSNPAAINY